MLVVSKTDTDSYQDQQRWEACATSLKSKASNNKDIRILEENVVLISLQNDLDLLSDVLHEESSLRHDIRDLSFDEEPI